MIKQIARGSHYYTIQIYDLNQAILPWSKHHQDILKTFRRIGEPKIDFYFDDAIR